MVRGRENAGSIGQSPDDDVFFDEASACISIAELVQQETVRNPDEADAGSVLCFSLGHDRRL
jgi:hypothetical protein